MGDPVVRPEATPDLIDFYYRKDASPHNTTQRNSTMTSTLANTVSFPELSNAGVISQAQQEDFEVEEILNDIGIFAEGDFGYGVIEAFDAQAPQDFLLPAMTTSSDATRTSLAPVSPDHKGYISSPIPELSTSGRHEISPSASVENLETFSVPNPMASLSSSVPNPVAPARAVVASVTVTPPIAPKATTVPAPITTLTPPVPMTVSAKISAPPSKKSTKTKKQSKAKAPAANRKRKISTSPSVTALAHAAAAAAASPPKSRSGRADSNTFTAASVASAKSSTLFSLEDPEGILTEEQMEERRHRNREHAKRSRQRKKSLTSTLQQSVEELRAENVAIRRLLEERLGKSTLEASLEARKERGRKAFLQGLSQPANKVVDEATLTFLKSLRKSLGPAAAVAASQQSKLQQEQARLAKKARTN